MTYVVCVSEKVAIYARQSIDKAEGIDRQKARCLALCEARAYSVAEIYEDNEVSATRARGASTAWARMLADIETGRIDVVIAVDIDRLLRRMDDLLLLTKLKVKVLTVSGEIDLTTPDGEFRAHMLASIAQYETRQKGERQTRANAARVEAGRPVPGRRRYGYEPDNMTLREPEAQDLRDLYKAFLAGASIRSLARAREWRNVRVRETLQNPSYKGWVKHKNTAARSALIQAAVTEEDWDAAQVILADPTRKTTPGRTPKHLASGIAACGVCGEPMFYMRSYRCRANSAHPSILKRTLDALIGEEVFMWAVTAPEEKESRQVLDITRVLVETIRQRDAQQELYVIPGADRAKAAKELARLGGEIETAERELLKARSAELTSDILRQVRAGWWERRDVKEYTPNEEAALEAWGPYWEGLPVEARRAVVRRLFTVVVNPGRDAYERVVITPK